MSQILFINLSSWIIQDGNYGDFTENTAARFALEFYPEMVQQTSARFPILERVKGSHYQIQGQVVYSGASAWVIDFGLMAFRNQGPPPIGTKTSWVEGQVSLGIDPFFYFEELHTLPDMPALQYNWHIKSILLETTPWQCGKDVQGRTHYTRGQPLSFRQINKTDAWKDDDGRADYLLECEWIG